MKNEELKALVRLLDDPDEGIYTHVRSKFLEVGFDAIPLLEETWESIPEVIVQQRIESIIHTINSQDIYTKLTNWIQLGGQNLLNGALLVAKYQYHELNEEKIRSKINRIRQDVWIELHDDLTALEKVKIINHILFEIHGFRGDRENFHAPRNSFLNRVLETGKGTPLSIGIIYAIIAQGLDIPIYGVNLPHHFILAYEDESSLPFAQEDIAHPGILFYINPFNQGAAFGKNDILEFLKQINVEAKDNHFVPCSNIRIIRRMIANIVYAYEKANKPEKADHFKHLLELFDDFK